MTLPVVGGCTVVTRNYLADARLAARSFVEAQPGTRFTILVVDGDHTPPATWTHRDVELVTPGQLGLPEAELLAMAAIYSPFEMACALKPLALRRVLDRADVAVVVDGDVEVLHPMPELIDAAADHDVVLVPHLLAPMPRDGRMPDEEGILAAGTFNGGLLAVRTGSGAFLDWWEERLRRDCLAQPWRMMLADQRWLDLVPSLFDHHVLRDPTYDVAYWNLHERPTSWADGHLQVFDRPVRCFHYSGLSDERPWVLSTFAAADPRVSLTEVPAVARLCRGWLDRRRAVGAQADRALGYHWGASAEGTPLDARSRMAFRDALLEAERDPSGRTPVPPSPFADDRGAAWRRWLASPPPEGTVGRYLLRVWGEDPQRAGAFPEVHGRDRAAFLAWAAGPGADDAAIPDAFRPPPEEADVPPTVPARPLRRPPRPDATAQRPVEALATARGAVERGPQGPPGAAGKVVGRLLAGRDRHTEETATALAEAVEELARRVADLSARVDRTNDEAFAESRRTDELAEAVTSARTAAEAVDADLGQRLVDVETGLAAVRADLDGALDQDRITAGIVSEAESRLADALDDLRLRVAKLAVEPDDDDPGTTAPSPDTTPDPHEDTTVSSTEDDAR